MLQKTVYITPTASGTCRVNKEVCHVIMTGPLKCIKDCHFKSVSSLSLFPCHFGNPAYPLSEAALLYQASYVTICVLNTLRIIVFSFTTTFH